MPCSERAWRRLWAMAGALVLVLWAWPAAAHKASDAYLQLRGEGERIELRWDIALRDLDAALDLDRNTDGKLSWGEVRTRLDEIRGYALAHLRLQDGRCALSAAQPAAVDDRIDGAYLVLQLEGRCEPAPTMAIEYRLFREVDPTHRGLLRIEADAAAGASARSLDPTGAAVRVAWPGAAAPAAGGTGTLASSGPPPAAEASPGGPASAGAGGSSFFQDGVHHILIGYDHVLFLICLLLPAVLRREAGGWQPVARWRDAVWPIVGMVTMFTVAHSITLALAGLKLVTVSPRLVEPAIALTIMVAALDNLRPILGGRRRLFSFLFGLVHGFGFAGVLGELDLPASGFALALLQFNLGVEAGQLVVVGIALGLLVSLRRWRGYPRVVLGGGSAAALVVAGLWFVERVFDVQLMTF